MTVLYRLDAGSAEIARQFGAEAGADPWSGGTIGPGQFAPVITAGREAIAGPGRANQPRRMIPRLWGVPPPGRAIDTGRGVLTVRNAASPFWIGNLRNAEFRCLVPATAFMAWGGTDPATGKRRAHWLAPTDQPLFACAGVWKDSEVPSFALLTAPPNALLREIGGQSMPVILTGGEAQRTWLRGDWVRAAVLIAPYASSLMRECAPGGR